MTVTSFDAQTETGSVNSTDSVWSNARDASSGYTSDYTIAKASYLSDANEYKIWRIFLYFNTSTLPDDATINSAKIKFDADTVWNDDGNPIISAVDGTQGDALDNEDFDACGSTIWGNVTCSSTGSYEISLDSNGISNINKTGITTYCLREDSHDIDNSSPPSGDGDNKNGVWVRFIVVNSESSILLEVNYTYANPSVTTNSATSVNETTATLNGEVTSFGGGSDWTDCWFLYSSQGNPTNETGKIRKTSTGAYSSGITSLTPIREFNYKAKVENEQGQTDTGGQQTFYSRPYEPTALSYTTLAPSGIQLNWTSGNYSTSSMIRYSANVIPTSTSEGELIYFKSGQSYVHSAQRITGDTHYYSFWSYNSGGATWDAYSAGYETLATSFEKKCKNVTTDNWYGDLEGALAQVSTGEKLMLSGNYTQNNSNYNITTDNIQISGQDKSAKVSSLTLTDVSGIILKSFTLVSSLSLESSSNYCTIYDLSSNSSGFSIKLIDSYRNDISGNKIYYASNQGIYASGANTFHNYIYDNDIYSGNMWGVYIDSTVISSNIWKHNKSWKNTSGDFYV